MKKKRKTTKHATVSESKNAIDRIKSQQATKSTKDLRNFGKFTSKNLNPNSSTALRKSQRKG